MSIVSSSSEPIPPDGSAPTRMTENQYRATIFTAWHSGLHYEAMKLAFRDKVVDCELTRRLIKALATYRKLLVIGHGSASKTFTATAFNLLKWWSNPTESSFILTSATIKSLRHRAWADMKLLTRDVKVQMPGKIMSSQYMVRHDPIDEKHVIMAVSGEDEQSVTKIQGAHPPFTSIVIDEADNSYNVAIWKAVANLGTSGDLKIVGLANPMDRNSVFGMNCEPEGGWDSIDINSSEEWESRNGYHVIRLDGLKSPNIVAGKVIYPFLLSPDGIKDIITEFGENSPNYFTYVRAWFPDVGAINTMFSGALVTKMEQQEIKFYADATPVAACDPSLGGGNRCVMMIGRAGLMAGDPRKGCVEVEKLIYIKHRDPSLPVTHDFATQMKEICLENGIDPEFFSIGCSTADLGIVDYLRQFWSNDIYAIDPAGKAGRRRILQEDTRNPEDRFDRKLTEMYWIMREWAKSGQLAVREVSRDLRIQCEARRWNNTEKNQLKLETKDSLKKRGMKSPDECFVAGTQVLTKHGNKPIEEIESGELVWTRDGLRKVFVCKNTGEKPTKILNLSNGTTLQGTGNHPIFTSLGWKNLDSLRSGDYIVSLCEKQSPLMGLTSQDTPTQNIELSGSIITHKLSLRKQHFTDTFTKNITAKFRQDSTYTTLMETPKITTSQISQQFQNQNTRNFTQTQTQEYWNWLERARPMQGKGRENGLRSIPDFSPIISKRRSSSGLGLLASVNGAKWNSKPDYLIGKSFAVNPTTKNGKEKQGCYTKSESVLIAEKISEQKDTGQLRLVLVRVERVCESSTQNVYNLSVEDCHEYFANGILVHNCDALANLVTMVRDKFGDLEATNLPFDPQVKAMQWPTKQRDTSSEFQPSYKSDITSEIKLPRGEQFGDDDVDRYYADGAD